MDGTLIRADIATHLRIVVLALIAGIVVVLIGIGARVSTDKIWLAEPQIESTPTQPDRTPVKIPSGKVVLV